MLGEAELGPLDIQIPKVDELGERESGLTPAETFQSLRAESFRLFEYAFINLRRRSGSQISTRTAADVATAMATGLLAPIFSQIDPMRLGEVQRAMMIMEEYGERLAGVSKNVKEGAIQKLSSGYPSHSFVIDRDEAREMFENVSRPACADLADMLHAVGEESISIFDPDRPAGSADVMIGYLNREASNPVPPPEDDVQGDRDEHKDADDSPGRVPGAPGKPGSRQFEGNAPAQGEATVEPHAASDKDADEDEPEDSQSGEA